MRVVNFELDGLEVSTHNGKVFTFQGCLECTLSIPTVVLGKNASGKSTLLTSIAYNLGYQFGNIKQIKSPVDFKSQFESEPRIAFVRQEPPYNFLGDILSEEFLVTFLNSDQEKFSEDLKRLLQHHLDFLLPNQEASYLLKNFTQLSSGQQQMVAIAMTLLTNADIVFFDEPFEYLSDQSRRKVLQLIATYNNDNKFILIALHADKSGELGKEILTTAKLYKIERKYPDIEILPEASLVTKSPLHSLSDEELVKLKVSSKSFYDEMMYIKESGNLPSNGIRCISASGMPLTHGPIKDVKLILKSDRRTLVNIASLQLNKGINVIYGDNGSGKTLTAKFISGKFKMNPIFPKMHLPFLTGSIYAEGTKPILRFDSKAESDEYSLSELNDKVLSVYLPTDPWEFISGKTPEIELNRVFDNTEAKKRLAVLYGLGIDTDADKGQLSFGQQKVWAFMTLPKKLLLAVLDEPFANLDTEFQCFIAKCVINQIEAGHWSSVVITSNKPEQTFNALRMGLL